MNYDAMNEYQKNIDAQFLGEIDEEQLANYNCPNCNYPVVLESGLEVCYYCGWYKGQEQEGYYDE